jgi:hypothetical protein
MKPLERAYVPDSERDLVVNDLLAKWRAGDAEIRALYEGADEATFLLNVRAQLDDIGQDEVWMNDQYQVTIRKWGHVFHLSIKRIDREPCRDWRDFQAIKNQLVGSECEAVELYPAESRLVDSANQYHLWGQLDPAFRFPFGFTGRMVSNRSIGKSVNRPHERQVEQ